MSRTDAHVPHWVAKAYYGHEDHEHRFGECDYTDGPTRFPRHNYSSHFKKCLKIKRYRVLCQHYYRTQLSYDYSHEYKHPSHKSDGIYSVHDVQTDELVTDYTGLKFYKNCYEEDYPSYQPTSIWLTRSYREVEFKNKFNFGESFAYHSYIIDLSDASTPCECDEWKRSFYMCEKSLDWYEGRKFYSYSRDSWSYKPRKSRGRVKQDLKCLAASYDEDSFSDLEDVPGGQNDWI